MTTATANTATAFGPAAPAPASPAPAAPPPAGDNIADALKALRKQMKALGADQAQGETSRTSAAEAVVSAAYEGIIDSDDVPDIYADFAAGRATYATKANVALDGTDITQASAKQQISKLRQFAKMGALNKVDARDVFTRARDVFKNSKAAGTATYSEYDALLNVARAQIKSPDTPLTDEDIEALIVKPEGKEKSDIDRLIAVYKAAHRLADSVEVDGLHNAVDNLREAITACGGEVPAMTKGEKEGAAAMAFLSARGLTIAQIVTEPDN